MQWHEDFFREFMVSAEISKRSNCAFWIFSLLQYKKMEKVCKNTKPKSSHQFTRDLFSSELPETSRKLIFCT